MKLRIILLLSMLLAFSVLKAQVNVFASAKLDRTSVYPQQPIKASITIYTETWFTKPLDIESIQVPNAFVLPFKRTLSSMREVNGKKYASLEFFYLIYPYRAGNYAFPEIIVGVETPPVGDYKGVSVNVKTQSLSFQVKDKPREFSEEEWFVARDVEIIEKWNKPLNSLRVGDVVERRITLIAKGTLPNFIPDITIEDEEFAAIYKQSPQLEDQRTSQAANGMKTESFLYLLSEEGEFMLPEVRVTWWNPYASRAYFKAIPAQEITIKENPDLGMLTTLKDSLNQVAGVEMGDAPSELSWWQSNKRLIYTAVATVTILLVLYTMFMRGLAIYQLKRTAYRNTEVYAFGQLQHKTGEDFDLALHKWWSKFYVVYGLSPSLNHEFRTRNFIDNPNFNQIRRFRDLIISAENEGKHFSEIQAFKK